MWMVNRGGQTLKCGRQMLKQEWMENFLNILSTRRPRLEGWEDLVNVVQLCMWAHHLWYDLFFLGLSWLKLKHCNGICFCYDCFLLSSYYLEDV